MDRGGLWHRPRIDWRSNPLPFHDRTWCGTAQLSGILQKMYSPPDLSEVVSYPHFFVWTLALHCWPQPGDASRITYLPSHFVHGCDWQYFPLPVSRRAVPLQIGASSGSSMLMCALTSAFS